MDSDGLKKGNTGGASGYLQDDFKSEPADTDFSILSSILIDDDNSPDQLESHEHKSQEFEHEEEQLVDHRAREVVYIPPVLDYNLRGNQERIDQQEENFNVSSVQISDSSNKSRQRRFKHPAAPKNPMSAYLFFVAEQRTQLSGTADSQRFSEVAKSLGRRWRSMSAAERAPYVELARHDKERYLREKESFGLQRIYLSREDSQ
jgi:hypothetical protein